MDLVSAPPLLPVAASHFRLSRYSTTRGDGKVRDTKVETGGEVEEEGGGGRRGAENKTDSVRREEKSLKTMEFRDAHV